MTDENNAASAPGVGNAAAIGLTLAAGSPIAEDARAYLREQTELVKLQRQNLIEQNAFELSHLRFRRFGDYARTEMETGIAILVALIVVGLGALVWQAHEAGGLVAEPLKTPSDFAARGLDGTVLAQQLLDRLNALVEQVNTDNLRKPDSISGSWSGDIKVQIPSTGISIDELSRLLRGWLGHETHVSGEVWRDGDRIALTVRAGSGPARTFEGKPSDLGLLMDKAADALLRQTQPFVYSSLLFNRNDIRGAIALSRALTVAGSASDRALAFTDWGSGLTALGKYRQAILPYARGIELAPDDPMPPFFATNSDIALDHGEAFARHAGEAAHLFATASTGRYRLEVVSALLLSANSMLAQTRGDFAQAVRNDEIVQQSPLWDYDRIGALVTAADLARDHDPAAARAILADHPDYTDGKAVVFLGFVGAQLPVSFVDADTDDWQGGCARNTGSAIRAEPNTIRRRDKSTSTSCLMPVVRFSPSFPTAHKSAFP